MVSKLLFWLKCSRVYTLPITFFSWLIAFTYSYKHNGNISFGLLALIGISFCHLATNLFDDYIDFKTLKKEIVNGKIALPNARKDKCDYILNNSTTPQEIIKTISIYLIISGAIGLFFILTRGLQTLLFMTIGTIIILLYPLLSKIRLSEFAIGLAYGPLLFGGTYFVMTGNLSLNSILISIPSMIFTLNIIYADTLMDYESDKLEKKKTFVGLFNKLTAKKFQIILLSLGYLTATKITPLVFLTLPIAIQSLKNQGSFLLNMYKSRDLMVYTSILLTLAILL